MSKKLSHVLLIGVGLFSSTWVVAAVKEYDLTIAEQTVNITGKPLKRITVNGKFVAPLLEFEEGDDAIIRVHNKLKKTRFFYSLARVNSTGHHGWRTRI